MLLQTCFINASVFPVFNLTNIHTIFFQVTINMNTIEIGFQIRSLQLTLTLFCLLAFSSAEGQIGVKGKIAAN